MARNLLSNRFVFAAVALAFVAGLGITAAWGNSVVDMRQCSGQANLAVAMDPTDPLWPGSSGQANLAVAMEPTDPLWPGSSGQANLA
jgi:hypothetical protein